MPGKYRLKLLIALIAAQALFLVGIASSSYAAGRLGQEIRIRTAPVDPRDVMYGDYIVLSYDISRLDKSLWREGGDIPKRGETVYVLLKQSAANGGIYEAAGAFRSKPAAGSGEAVLKGRVDYSFDNRIRVRYGLEKYYVAEHQGKELEKKAGAMIAVVAVAPWGQTVLERLEEGR
ncbi:GDYXXLXY domain-containing protein [Gordoniibacillus kamchatkensis]|nr:GDYXXLXY domain-containing protein [Paenibacillus sp. VKM B-2647]